MRLFTIQVGKWRLARDRDIIMLDTTVKSGYGLFAPNWDMVMGHKAGTLSDEEYTRLYRQRLIDSWVNKRKEWMAFVQGNDLTALACYCKAGKFCHRLLLVEFLKELAETLNKRGEKIEFEYYGELTDETPQPDEARNAQTPVLPAPQ